MTSQDFPEQDGAALVIGGSGGIGRAICAALAAAGTDVAFTYRSNAGAAAEVVAEVEGLGRQALALPMALEDAAGVKVGFERVLERFGRVHTIVNAAGSHIPMKFISAIAPDEFAAVMNADANGFFNLVHATLPHLLKQGGSYVAITTAGLSRWPTKDALSVAPKAAIHALVTGVAREEGRHGIRANTVALGLIDAGLFLKLKGTAYDDSYLQAALRNSALKRLGTAEEVAEAVLFFASHRARFVTGQSLTLDGGYSL
ncbi:MAG: SDR family NAD(P)-dependent oxidoreductase [Steroidobacteraceae bacterium]